MEEYCHTEAEPLPPCCACIVTGDAWYFAVPLGVPAADALTVGKSYTLSFSDSTAAPRGQLLSLSGEEAGQRLAVFRSTDAPGDTLCRAGAGVRILLARWEGFSLPKTAVLLREDGAFVRRLSPLGEETAEVRVVWEDEDTVLVTSAALREGSRVAAVFEEISY